MDREPAEGAGPGTNVIIRIFVSILLLAVAACAPPRPDYPVIGAKNFTEQVVLGELQFRRLAGVHGASPVDPLDEPLRVDRGVDQFADSLARPRIVDGLMEPLPEHPGFGPLVNGPWLAEQDGDDPDGLIRELAATERPH